MVQYSDEVKLVIHISESYAKDSLNNFIHPAHIFKALLHKDIGLMQLLEEMKKDYFYLLDWADARIKLLPKTSKVKDKPLLDNESIIVFEEADNYRLKFNKEKIDPFCLLVSLTTPGVGFRFEQLKALPLTQNELIDFYSASAQKTNLVSSSKSNPDNKPISGNKQNALFKYCFDKTSLSRQELLPKVIGMDKEILSIIETLGRKTKSNLLIVGESGVGKTSLINGLSHHIAFKKVPENLSNANIFELDVSSLVVGASYKGEIEDRFKKLIEELENFEKAILVIESFENITDKHNNLNTIVGILKQELNKGAITIIGSSTVSGFTKSIETENDIVRKFEVLKIEEPTEEITFRIIHETKSIYEDHHKLKIDDELVKIAIKLARRYLTEKCLPDSAIDLIDRTMSLINTMNEVSEQEICDAIERLEKVKTKTDSDDSLILELKWLYDDIFNRISNSLITKIDDSTDFGSFATKEEKIMFLAEFLNKLKELSKIRRDNIEESDISIIVSQLTGIPLGKLQSKERDKLINAEDTIKARVVGQDHAIKTIIESIYESRSGLNKKGQPIGSFFFLGPTGTGKTELAKSLAEFLFQDESSMIRFDMSEFKEEHSAALLYGAPPGYVGYEEGGLLVNKIRQKPYSVVLFDEIEKAHKSVFDIFLQILDEGKLHDRLGREGDFSNSLVLFTSNIGSDFIFKSFEKKEIPASNKLLEIMTNYFRPEFLGRLTEIIPFAPITEEVVTIIFDINMKSIYKTLGEMGIQLSIQPAAKKQFSILGYSPQYGARPVLGVIRNHIRRPLSKLIISGKIAKGSSVNVDYSDNEFKWNF